MGQVGLQYVRHCTHFPLYRASSVNVADLLPDVFCLMVRIFRLVLVLLYI